MSFKQELLLNTILQKQSGSLEPVLYEHSLHLFLVY